MLSVPLMSVAGVPVRPAARVPPVKLYPASPPPRDVQHGPRGRRSRCRSPAFPPARGPGCRAEGRAAAVAVRVRQEQRARGDQRELPEPLIAPEIVNCVPLAGAKAALLARTSGAAIVWEPAVAVTVAGPLAAHSVSTAVPRPVSIARAAVAEGACA